MKNFFSRFRCPFSFVQALNGSEALKVSTKYGTSWRLYSDHVGNFVQDQDKHAFSCEFRPRNYGQFGVYSLTSVSDGKCDITTVHPPCQYLLTLCILIMIFVNDGGGHYTFFNHATWNGLHVADLLFPWFMWIMGVCIPIAIRSQLRRNITRLQIIGSIIKRSCTLFLLGLALNTVRVGADLTQIRIFGVLQRFAVVFFVVAILVTFLMISLYHPHKATMQGPFSDVANLSILWVLMFALLAGYSYLTFYFPVPGCPIGYLGPGGIHYNGIFKNCTGGVAGYIDKFLLSSRHIYQRPTASAVYLIGPYDPEGPYGCILSVLQVFFGVQAGATILSFPGWRCRLKRWLLWGVLLGVIGTILCQARQEGGWIPINKNLWSLSFVAVTSSLGFFLLSIMHYLIDVKRWWSGAPFIYPGRHSISIAIIINNNCYLCNLFILVH
ncbi:unnamed protein product [Nesidiocoris tenuis]|uniref:Uncharacterized protein n=1 Tax=Nesidiocoris tenuis TaxID=355587 RepID=A0A6H5H9J7_9HEMI|nr:unnamed protein product [Nesidiocoris tenuis]